MRMSNSKQAADRQMIGKTSEKVLPSALPEPQRMRVEVRLTREPIRVADGFAALMAPGVDGAVAEFTGIVRGEENGQPIEAIEYEAYEAMAPPTIRKILGELGRDHPCSAVSVVHRLGLIRVGEAAIWVGVASQHRGEAFALLTEFMDVLKRDVPIWKRRARMTGARP
jgi:molybdopterin synthase catalytic subunit